MGIAILTKFHGPTNTRGSRYSASAGGKPGGGSSRILAPASHGLNPIGNRVVVARALAAKLDMRGLWIAAGLDGSDVAFARMPVSDEKAADIAAMMLPASEGEDWFYLAPEAY